MSIDVEFNIPSLHHVFLAIFFYFDLIHDGHYSKYTCFFKVSKMMPNKTLCIINSEFNIHEYSGRNQPPLRGERGRKNIFHKRGKKGGLSQFSFFKRYEIKWEILP